jgi:hypothetical protein
MTKEEAKQFIALLKEGKIFGTRFQENEWGMNYLENGKFRKWSRTMKMFTNEKGKLDSRDDHSEEEMTEEAVFELFTKYYKFDVMVNKLR